MKIPLEINAGDSISWKDDPSSDNLGNPITSSSHTLTYELRGPTSLSLTASADGDGWITTLETAESEALSAGTYYWAAYATDSPDRVTLGRGTLKVIKNLEDVSGVYDGRSQTQKDLDAVQKAMRAMIEGGAVQEYSIGNRSLRKITLADLMVLEAQLKAQVAREKKAESIANGLGNPSNVFVRFQK